MKSNIKPTPKREPKIKKPPSPEELTKGELAFIKNLGRKIHREDLDMPRVTLLEKYVQLLYKRSLWRGIDEQKIKSYANEQLAREYAKQEARLHNFTT